MRRTRFTEEQIIAVNERETGPKTADLARKHGISEATFHNWKTKFGSRPASNLESNLIKPAHLLTREGARAR